MKNKLRIKSVNMTGFRKHKDSMIIDCSHRTLISGDNKKGKTTVFHAIVWAFTGYSKDGKKNELHIINNQSTKAQVIVTFELNDTPHIIERSLTANGTQTIKFDNSRVAQKDIEQIVPSSWILASNPFYLIEMDASKAREVLLEKVEIEHQEIIKNMNIPVYLTEEVLKDNKSLKGFRKQLNETLRKIEKLRVAKKSLEETQVKSIPYTQEPLNALRTQIAVLRKQLEEELTKHYVMTTFEKEYKQQQVYLLEKEKMLQGISSVGLMEIEGELKEAQQKKLEIENSAYDTNEEIKLLEREIESKLGLAIHLRDEIKGLNQKLEAIDLKKYNITQEEMRLDYVLEKKMIQQEKEQILSSGVESNMHILVEQLKQVQKDLECFDQNNVRNADIEVKKEQQVALKQILQDQINAKQLLIGKGIEIEKGRKHITESHCPYCNALLTSELRAFLEESINKELSRKEVEITKQIEALQVEINKNKKYGHQLNRELIELEAEVLNDRKGEKDLLENKKVELEAQIKAESLLLKEKQDQRKKVIQELEVRYTRMELLEKYNQDSCYAQQLTEELEKIVSDYNKVCSEGKENKEKLCTLQNEATRYKSDFETEKANLLRLQDEKINHLNKRFIQEKSNLQEEEKIRKEKINQLDLCIKSLNIEELERKEQDKKKDFEENQDRIIDGIQSQLLEVEKQYQKELEITHKIEALQEQQQLILNKIQAKEDELNSLDKDRFELSTKIAQITEYIKTKSILFNEKLNLPHTEIRLEKISQSDGELTTCFEVLYHDKEDGSTKTHSEWCTSERIAIGKELSEMLLTLMDVTSFIFIDCAESITTITDSVHQQFILEVRKGQPFNVSNDTDEDCSTNIA